MILFVSLGRVRSECAGLLKVSTEYGYVILFAFTVQTNMLFIKKTLNVICVTAAMS